MAEKEKQVTRAEFDALAAKVRKMSDNWKKFAGIHLGREAKDGEVKEKGGYVRATMTLALLLGVAGAAIGANFVKYGASDYWTDTGDLVIAGDITSVGLTASGTNLVFSGIATSTNGLTSGMLYSNSGVVTVF